MGFEISPELFAQKRRAYFTKLAETYRDALRLHENPGKLWERDATGKDWRNVTEHCLMETARALVFAKKLGLPPDVTADLATAAALHDFYKKVDIQYTREDIAAGGSGRQGYLRSEREAAEYLRKVGYSGRIIRISDSTNGEPETIIAIKDMLDKKEIPDEDLAYIVMHYIDDYTAGSDWVMPASEEGINDLDRRAMRNARNADYQKMNQEALISYKGHPFFRGKTRFEAQALMGHLIENKLAELIAARGGEKIEPLRLPEVIDAALRTGIEKIEL